MKKSTKQARFSVRNLILACVLSAVLGVTVLLILLYAMLGQGGMSLLKAQALIQTQFVGEYERDRMADDGLRGMIYGLGDRWSYYLSADEYASVKDARSNAYVGIGVTVSCEDGKGLRILTVEPGSPADTAGICADELIVAVDGVEVWQENAQDCVEDIRGEEGTSLSLTVEAVDGTQRSVGLQRARLKTIPVRAELLSNQVGLVKIVNFYSGTADLFETEVKKLIDQGAKALVFDVRNNPGGYVTELTRMLDFLLPAGTVFISRDVRGNESTYRSEASAISLPMAVLVNADSYSAAEFFAAELRESAGAAVVGEQTTGKGYSQQLFSLPNGGALGLSTSKYYTGDGISLIGVGLKPEPAVSLTEEQSLQLRRGSLQEDPQLQAALQGLGYTG